MLGVKNRTGWQILSQRLANDLLRKGHEDFRTDLLAYLVACHREQRHIIQYDRGSCRQIAAGHGYGDRFNFCCGRLGFQRCSTVSQRLANRVRSRQSEQNGKEQQRNRSGIEF